MISTAVVTGVTLQLKRYKLTGDPFATLGNLNVDIASPYFGAEMLLRPDDFFAPASAADVGFFNSVPLAGNWYEAVLGAGSAAAYTERSARVRVSRMRMWAGRSRWACRPICARRSGA